jgi:hypothetical protein
VLIDSGTVEITLLAAAVLVGATGTWSPCGFSMIETIGPTGHTGGRWVTPAACATFLPGAVAGGLITFGGLALAGSVLPGGWLSYALAGSVALAAAVAEARGSRIAPQIRRQLPEHWRRVMPMPLAAALYGVLLGLGFTTFVLTFGVWALAGVALALGDPAVGLALGAGFGVGRALPIVALAPIADRPTGRAAVDLMAARPGLYRGIRLGDSLALVAAAVALFGAAGAEAEVKHARPAADPSVSSGDFVSQRGTSRAAELRAAGGGGVTRLPGTDPAIGGSYIAVIRGGDVVLLARSDLAEVSRVAVPDADAVAVSDDWLAVRRRPGRRDRLQVRSIASGGSIGESRPVATAAERSQIGRPSLGGNRIAYAVASPSKNKLVIHRPGTGERNTILRSHKAGLSNPSLYGQAMLYVRTERGHDELRLRKLKRGGRDRRLRSRNARMWSTALSEKRAYVTILAGTKPASRVISVKR